MAMGAAKRMSQTSIAPFWSEHLASNKHKVCTETLKPIKQCRDWEHLHEYTYRHTSFFSMKNAQMILPDAATYKIQQQVVRVPFKMRPFCYLIGKAQAFPLGRFQRVSFRESLFYSALLRHWIFNREYILWRSFRYNSLLVPMASTSPLSELLRWWGGVLS